MRERCLDEVGDLSEHADDVLTATQGHGADLDRHAAAVRVDEREARVGDGSVPTTFRANSSARAASPRGRRQT